MFKKQSFNTGVTYVAPLCEALEVKVEGMFCGSPNGWNEGGAGNYGSGEINDNGSY